jgi:proteasome lid subunit RPN8/RPN11
MFPAIPLECLNRIKNYLLEDVSVERGCIVTKTWELIPFENTSSSPLTEIRQGPETFSRMVDLLKEDNLHCWAHSHPLWQPFPSMLDIAMHHLPVGMLIYGVPTDTFGFFSSNDINALETRVRRMCIEDKNSDDSDWKEISEMRKVFMGANLLKMPKEENADNDVQQQRPPTHRDRIAAQDQTAS